MLYRREVVDVVLLWNDDYSAGVLTGGSLNARTSVSQTLFLSLVKSNTSLLEVFHYVSVCILFGDCAESAGSEHVLRSEEHFRVLVHLALYVSGEVQIDIGRLVPLETEEGLKRYVVSVAYHRRAAFGAVFRRYVKARADRAVRYKFRVEAFRTPVMRRKGIDFGNACHRRNERRADRAS